MQAAPMAALSAIQITAEPLSAASKVPAAPASSAAICHWRNWVSISTDLRR